MSAESLRQRLQDLANRTAAAPSWKPKELGPSPAKTAIPATVGVGKDAGAGSRGTGAGVASPLTETTGTRTYYDSITQTSSDGIFTVVVRPVHELYTTDASGSAIKFIFNAQ